VSELLGKQVVVAITCVDASGRTLDEFQTHGMIEVVNDEWIGIRREGLTELFGLPPAPELLEPAEAGVFTLQPTGEQVESPDYTASLTVNVSDAESILAIRGLGFAPGAQ
jgi:hypothetical protein